MWEYCTDQSNITDLAVNVSESDSLLQLTARHSVRLDFEHLSEFMTRC